MNHVQLISNLLFQYAEYIDDGQLDSAADMFSHAQIKISSRQDQFIGKDELLALWKKIIILYPCGTPKTKHVITNPIIQIDESLGVAKVKSYFNVFQPDQNQVIHLILSGRYYDEFQLQNEKWVWTHRDYTHIDFAGNLSLHLKDFELRH
jgi:3-phenylpropionate/cinnamic acid dioxygenase small subunit